MQCFVKSIGRVTKPLHHPFQTVMHVRCEGPELSLFWTASEWAIECGICDEPRVQMRFRCHNPIILCCTIVGRAIGEQWSYATEISFGLIAHHKSMLYQLLLGGFRTYPFL
jgi:hypothetical protein